MKRTLIKSVMLASIFGLVLAQPALAYIDPNTGGLLFQMLAVAFASLSAIVLIFSRQIRTFFARVRRSLRDLSGNKTESPGTTALASDPTQSSGTSTEPSDQTH